MNDKMAEEKKQFLTEIMKEQKFNSASNQVKSAIGSAIDSNKNLKLNTFNKDALTETSNILWSVINSCIEKYTEKVKTLEEQVSENKSLKGALETKAENQNLAQKSLTCGICAGFLKHLEIGECQKCEQRHTEDSSCSGKVVEFRSKKCRKCGKISSEAEILIELESENNSDYRVKVLEGFKDRLRRRRIENKKSINCPFLIRKSSCKKDNECDFNHEFDPEKARADMKNQGETPRNRSNVECRNFKSSGFCKHGDRCNFIHNYQGKFNSDRTRYHPNQNWHPQIPHQQPPMNFQQQYQRDQHFLGVTMNQILEFMKSQAKPVAQNQNQD